MQRIVTTITNRLIVRPSLTIHNKHQSVSTTARYLDVSTFRVLTSRLTSLGLSSILDQPQSYRLPFHSFKQQQTQTSTNSNSRQTKDTIAPRVFLPWHGSFSLVGNDIQQHRTINHYQRRSFFTSSNWQDKDSPYTIIGVRYSIATIKTNFVMLSHPHTLTNTSNTTTFGTLFNYHIDYHRRWLGLAWYQSGC